MEKNLLPAIVNNSRTGVDLKFENQKDSLIHNMYIESFPAGSNEEPHIYAIKRPGLNNNIYSPSLTTGVGMGVFSSQNKSNETIYYFSKVGSNIYINSRNAGFAVSLGNFIAATSIYPQIKFSNVGLPDDTVNAIACHGDRYITLKGSAIITSTTYNTPLANSNWNQYDELTHIVYLNNRCFVGIINSGRIIQTTLGSFVEWPASEFLTVESYGGKLVDLARYNNYITAFKEYSLEFFEDVANQNGTVLGRVDAAIQQIGTVNPATIVDTGGGELIWLSNDESGKKHIAKLNNSFQVEFLEDDFVSKYLELVSAYDGSFAHLLNVNGHQFYVLTLQERYYPNVATDLKNTTLVYDLKTKLWYNWYTDGTSTEFDSGSFNYRTTGILRISGACKTTSGATLIQDITNGHLYQMDDAYGEDGPAGASIPWKIRFSPITLGTFKRKFVNAITVLLDLSQNPTQTVDVALYTDDGATGYKRTINSISTEPYELTGRAFGSFKRGAIEISGSQDEKVRIAGVVVNYDIGESHGIS